MNKIEEEYGVFDSYISEGRLIVGLDGYFSVEDLEDLVEMMKEEEKNV